MELHGLRALVTGAGTGIGRAIAERVAADGAIVHVSDVDAAGAAETVRRVRAAGGRAEPRIADLLVPAELAALAAEPVDLLVNNAGGGGHIPPSYPNAPPAEWSATLELNLRVPLLLAQLCGARAVVSIASIAGLGTDAYAGVEYAAAKAGLIRATTSLRGFTPRYSCVVPDWVETERARRELAAMPAAQRAAELPLVPLALLAEQVVGLLRDDTAAGRVVVLDRGEPPRDLDAPRVVT
ncbi:SDR family NAD(P)-dependent oxidoreductase [Pseudonocardia sp. TRM90224]|uniref:SDR family NAD(P)-dependent oxidoreductase n=1 Tax=Pseudonocardia sp. TRM90224 TaxID=2812678 RepID=UPI001E352BEC|nr:SDR family oxidoreductase [Pseudonocardia sp. TRM90224]